MIPENTERVISSQYIWIKNKKEKKMNAATKEMSRNEIEMVTGGTEPLAVGLLTAGTLVADPLNADPMTMGPRVSDLLPAVFRTEGPIIE